MACEARIVLMVAGSSGCSRAEVTSVVSLATLGLGCVARPLPHLPVMGILAVHVSAIINGVNGEAFDHPGLSETGPLIVEQYAAHCRLRPRPETPRRWRSSIHGTNACCRPRRLARLRCRFAPRAAATRKS